MLKAQFLKKTQYLTIWYEALKLLAEAGQGLAFLVVGLTLLQALFGIAILWFIKVLVEILNQHGVSEQASWQLAFVVGAIALLSLAGVLSNYFGTKQGIKVAEIVNQRIHRKAVSVDYSFYESPAYFDTLERARQVGAQRPAQMITNGLLLIKSSAFLSGAVVLLGALDWRILPAIFVSLLIVLAVRIKYTKAMFSWQRERVQKERRASYLDTLITADHHAKELRLSDLGEPLISDYQSTRSAINNGQLSIEREKAKSEFLVSMIGAAIFCGVSALLLFYNTSDAEAVSNVVLFLLLFRRAETSGREMIQSASKLYDDRLFLQQLFEFLNLENYVPRPENPLPIPDVPRKCLRFNDVSFTYPGCSTPALSDINLELPAGKVIALVGENGSGKTTLIKLLTRLYDPDCGSITHDDINTKLFDPVDFRREFSVVFQQFAVYAMTLRENVASGDMAHQSDDVRILDALQRGGAMDILEKLNGDLNAPLTRMFSGGHELSIGQWQRIALSRAFFRPSNFLVLDEPSSALDARAEFELFENLKERAQGRSVLIISHRLSTVSLADFTYVLDAGRIVEKGTHSQLANAGGKYSKLFEIQARRYR